MNAGKDGSSALHVGARLTCVFTLLLIFSGVRGVAMESLRVLVFTKTEGFRHGSITSGLRAFRELGQRHQFIVDQTEAGADFNPANLSRYSAVVFLNTTGNVLTAPQQVAFERYIQAGGGFMGIHAAADTENEWPWYNQLVGAYFASHPNHPNVRDAVIRVVDAQHPATALVPAEWARSDEWYNFRGISPGIRVLAELDEESYEGGTHGARHPIAWCREFDGGRAFYTGGGHTDSSFDEPAFREHLWGGLRSVMIDPAKLDHSRSRSRLQPEENRFEKIVLASGLASPMELAIASDGRVFFSELAGRLKVYDPATSMTTLIMTLDVDRQGGTGLLGVTVDPHFDQNRHFYVYYAPPEGPDGLRFNLSRFTLEPDGTVEPGSERILLQVPVSPNGAGHHGGSFAWDSKGNLYLSTGDSTAPKPSDGYAPLDERPSPYSRALDAQRTAGNTADLCGKILRITPKPDGSYTIPEGNLFPPGTPKTRPEIYVMGVRNPYRIAVNPRTDVLYWGDIGPDAGNDSDRGPKGYDEYNQAFGPGNFGWPYFIGDNQAYAYWNFADNHPGPRFDPAAPVNRSPNNTGLTNLPRAMPAMVWYPYAGSDLHPILGEGGRSGMVGEFYHNSGSNPRALPAEFKGALFVFDWMRNWVMAMRVDEKDRFQRFVPFMASNGDFRRPIDLAFDTEGRMYVLEYGSVYGVDNEDARLVRIEYNSGNRAPLATARIRDSEAEASEQRRSFLTSDRRLHRKILKQIAGPAPLTVQFAGSATDPDDGDSLEYQWLPEEGVAAVRSADVAHVFRQPGVYEPVLRVTDSAGNTSQDRVRVVVGNSPPRVVISSGGNRSFFWEDGKLPYKVEVSDAESLVDPSRLQVLFGVYQGGSVAKPIGESLIAASDCRACHTPEAASLGPSYLSIAQRYRGHPSAVPRLVRKIIEGGGGEWGSTFVMSAHPQLAEQDAEAMVTYILSLEKSEQRLAPVSPDGVLRFEQAPPGSPIRYLLKASYADEAVGDAPSIAVSDELLLRSALIPAEHVDGYEGFNRWGPKLAWGRHKAHLYLRNVDLHQIAGVKIAYIAPQPGRIEIRQHSLAGPVLGVGQYDAAAEDAHTFVPIPNAVERQGDLYFVIRQPLAPNENAITVRSVEFLKELQPQHEPRVPAQK